MKPVKFLFVDCNATLINPTPRLLRLALQGAGEMHVFGPGYVSQELLDRGLDRYIEDNGPFDMAFFTEQVRMLLLHNPVTTAVNYAKSAIDYDWKLLLHGPRYCEILRHAGMPLIATFLESDMYGWNQDPLRVVEDSGALALGWGEELWDMDDTDPRPPTTETDRKILALRTRTWHDYVRKNRHKFISMPHHLGPDEEWSAPLAGRRHSWIRQGAHYTTRLDAFNRLEKANVQYEDQILKYFWPVSQRLHINPYGNKHLIRFLNARFFGNFKNGKYVYTCGSAIRMLIRKYFEIPAYGCVLVCSPSTGLQAVGFQNGENCIVCEPEDILDVHAWLEANPDQAQRIADAGRQLVRTRHTVMARGEQLRPVLERIRAGTFSGAHWEKGVFTLREANK